MKDVFLYNDYKILLKAKIDDLNSQGHRGVKSKLAHFAQCQPAYLSQVLHGSSQLSLEQIDSFCSYFNWNEDEREFAVTLLSKQRAATESLRKYFDLHLQAIRERCLQVGKHIAHEDQVSESARAQYYGSWIYPAIHIVLGLPEVRTESQIARRLQLPLSIVRSALEFLVESRLVEKRGSVFLVLQNAVHLPRNHPSFASFHSVMRGLSARAPEFDCKSDIFYSSIVTLSKNDALRVSRIFLRSIQQTNKIIAPSGDEELMALNIDFFRVGRGA